MDQCGVEKYSIGGIESQLHESAWLKSKTGGEGTLSFEHDAYLKSYLLDGILNGFKIVDREVGVEKYVMHNYLSVYQPENWPTVNGTICQELESEKYKLVDFIPHCVHALGVITDCSSPKNRSINNFMMMMLQSSCNWKHSWRRLIYRRPIIYSVPVFPGHWQYQGVCWKFSQIGRQLLIDTRLCFGLRCAPFIFVVIT